MRLELEGTAMIYRASASLMEIPLFRVEPPVRGLEEKQDATRVWRNKPRYIAVVRRMRLHLHFLPDMFPTVARDAVLA